MTHGADAIASTKGSEKKSETAEDNTPYQLKSSTNAPAARSSRINVLELPLSNKFANSTNSSILLGVPALVRYKLRRSMTLLSYNSNSTSPIKVKALPPPLVPDDFFDASLVHKN